MIPLDDIRKQFPQLKNASTHYLDSAATSLTPLSVIGAVDEYYFDYRANVHRGLFREALRATERYEEARRTLATFIGAGDTSEVIFTAGATDSSNMFVRMLEESGMLAGKTNIVTTVMEHHSTLVPLQQLAKRSGLELRLIPLSGLALDMKRAETLIDDGTALVSVMHVSNVTGMINDVKMIAEIAHKHHAVIAVDATAGVGHIPVNVSALGCDALYFSGHKMLAPTGVGVLWMNKALLDTLPPAIFGGHMIARVEDNDATWALPPGRFEAGTKDIGGVIGLARAGDFLRDVGIEVIHAHTTMLAVSAIRRLEQIEGVHVFSDSSGEKNAGIVSFVTDFAHPHDVAEILARDAVAVRPGHHCALPLHKALGIEASTRASFHVYNTTADVDALVGAVESVRALFST